jgi:2-haloacid dehalogenase
MDRPSVIVCDVNETLSDMSPMASRFTDVGLAAGLAQTWFASVLRDGFALTAVGTSEKFAVLAEQLFRNLAERTGLNRDVDEAVQHVLSGFMSLPPHPDVVDGIHALRAAGLRLVTLSNGAAQVAENLLGSAGIRDEFEHVLSVEDAGAWKPARRAYEYAAGVCGVQLSQMMMVAVHPWDIDGAARAGMSTAWVNRTGGEYPTFFTLPVTTVSRLPELAERSA